MPLAKGLAQGLEGNMSISQTVSSHLPFLRRYARALTGSQVSGDKYVEAALNTLVNQPELISDKTSVMVEMSLEGFSEEEASRILGTGVTELRQLIDECGKELASQIATNIMIIEDEALIAMDLQSLVENLGHDVQGVARTRKEAVTLAKQQKPGLILADIQLADGSSGIDAVNDLLNTFEVPVIFITAYPERLLTGIRPEPTFLITKPYQPAMVSAVISQALFFERKAQKRQDHAVV
jgi:CheY-like chemotaxis protein